MTNAYPEGTLVTLTFAFKNPAGVLTDPTGVTLLYQYLGYRKPGEDGYMPPDAEVIKPFPDAAIRHPSTGNYEIDVDTTGKPGRVRYGAEGTGAVQATSENTFIVSNRTLRGGS